MELIALAIAPGIAICLFIFHRDPYNREPKINLLVAFILGALTVFPAGYLEEALMPNVDKSIIGTAVTAFLIVALSEESVKFAVLRGYAYPRKSFDEPLDGIVYSVVVSMGFATLENYFYVQKYGVQVGFMRMFLAVPGHATFGVVMGYFVGKAKFNTTNSISLMVKGLVGAVIFHGFYDFFLFLQQSPEIDQNVAGGLLFLGAVVSLIVALRLSFKHIKRHRKLSQQTYNPTLTMSLRKAFPTDIPIIRDLTHKIWPATYASILSKEQIDYMLNMMYSEQSLRDQMENGHQFTLIYDGVEAIGFTSFSLAEAGVYRLHKIYVLPSQQGRGTGRFAIDQLMGAMKAKGAQSLQLNVNRQNNAKEFYEKMGFAVIKEEDIDIGNGYFMNDYVMERKFS